MFLAISSLNASEKAPDPPPEDTKLNMATCHACYHNIICIQSLKSQFSEQFGYYRIPIYVVNFHSI